MQLENFESSPPSLVEMSNKKLTVEYIKPKVPAFLAKFKQETGYQEHVITDKDRCRDENEVRI